MGLDAVELVMEVEEAFDLSISDDAACDLVTVGQLYDYVIAHRFANSHQACLTSVTFHRLRHALMAIRGLKRSEVRPSLDLATAIPRNRRVVWSQLQEALDLRLPALVRPRWVVTMESTLTLLLFAVSFAYLTGSIGMVGAFCAASGVLVLAAVILYHSTKPLAVALSRDAATAGSLARCIMRKNYGTIFDQYKLANPNAPQSNATEVWNSLRDIIVAQLGVRPEEVTREANFVRDLGMS
jgi:acyl carrier protein